ncbi:MAG: hypothetical protein H6737_02415 [Alphaproteobacteria bacterium]|nr:hypothetical protein [Alphaproteobacteria bacterium]
MDMDLFVDLVAWVSMPGIFCVGVGPGLLGIAMVAMLVVGVLEGVPHGSAER